MNHNYKGEYVIFNDVYIDGGEQIIFAILLMRSGNGASQRFKNMGDITVTKTVELEEGEE